MYRYKNLLVGLNLSDLDKTTLPYAAMISRFADSEKAYFVHVTRYLMTPQNILEEYPNLLEPLDEFAGNKLEKTVVKYFEGKPTLDKHFEVVEGQPLDELLRRTRQKEIDLIVVGRKMETRQTRMLPLNLTREAPTSVLIIPEGAKPRINKILLPLDFSDCSANALEAARDLAIAAEIPKLVCLHAYRLPLGYYKTGKSESQFDEIMLNNARTNFKDFMHKKDMGGIAVTSLFVKDKSPANAIRSVVAKNKIDLIVIGARGRGAGAAALLGSVTENLIQTADVPVLAVKKKGAGMRFLDALFQLQAT